MKWLKYAQRWTCSYFQFLKPNNFLHQPFLTKLNRSRNFIIYFNKINSAPKRIVFSWQYQVFALISENYLCQFSVLHSLNIKLTPNPKKKRKKVCCYGRLQITQPKMKITLKKFADHHCDTYSDSGFSFAIFGSFYFSLHCIKHMFVVAVFCLLCGFMATPCCTVSGLQFIYFRSEISAYGDKCRAIESTTNHLLAYNGLKISKPMLS